MTHEELEAELPEWMDDDDTDCRHCGGPCEGHDNDCPTWISGGRCACHVGYSSRVR